MQAAKQTFHDRFEDQAEAVLLALGQAIDQRDHHTSGHCERIAFLSVTMGVALDLDEASLLALYRGGYLHDVGKVGIPDAILFKPGKLNPEEWVTMQSHTTRGVEICRYMSSLAPVLPIIRHHHERWDGSGYPDGLRGEQIPLPARILQLADIYDALTNVRPYKRAYSPTVALRLMSEEAERGWRDPELAGLFFRIHEEVISKLVNYTSAAGGSLQALRGSLSHLQRFAALNCNEAWSRAAAS